MVPLQLALKLGGEPRLPLGGIEPLYERLVTVTALPLCVKVPFQGDVMSVCPLGKLNFKVQPLIAVEPVLVMFTAAVKPVFHWLWIT